MHLKREKDKREGGREGGREGEREGGREALTVTPSSEVRETIMWGTRLDR